jgi:hypothetical protein
VLPGILGDGEDSLNGQLKRDLDEMVEARRAHQADSAVPVPHVVEFGTLGELVVHPPIVDKVKQLMGAYGNKRTDCSLHHIHAARHDEGEGPSYWHQVRAEARPRARVRRAPVAAACGSRRQRQLTCARVSTARRTTSRTRRSIAIN